MKQIIKIKQAANQCLLSTEIGLKDRLSTDVERLKMECLTFLGETAKNAVQVEAFKMQGIFISAAAIYLKSLVLYRLEVTVYINGILGYVAVCMERMEEDINKFGYSFLAVQPEEIAGKNLFNFYSTDEAVKVGIRLATAIISGDINLTENGN